MRVDPIQVLRAAGRPGPAVAVQCPSLVVAGATGALGNAVLQRLVGTQRFSIATVLARETITAGLRGVQACVVPGVAGAPVAPSASDVEAAGCCVGWPTVAATTGLVMFDPPRLYYQRERALWTPAPAQLPAVARWMRACGVTTLAVVVPHVQGRLPDALKRGLASLDEQAVAALGFERLLIVRSAEKPVRGPASASWLRRVAHGVLGAMHYMVPSSEQPVRASKIADLVDLALREMGPGTHVAGPELLWQASQEHLPTVVRGWLGQGAGAAGPQTEAESARQDAPGAPFERNNKKVAA